MRNSPSTRPNSGPPAAAPGSPSAAAGGAGSSLSLAGAVRLLLRYLRPWWPWVALAPFAMGLESAMDLAQPAFMRRIVDEGVRAGNLEVVRSAGWRMLAFALLGSLGGLLCTYVSARAATGAGNDLRKAVFSRVLRLSPAQVDRLGAGSVTTRLADDVGTLQFLVVAATRMMLRAPFLLFGSIALVFLADARLAVPLLASAPVLAWIVVRFMRRMVPLFRERQERTDALASRMQEALAGVRVVKSFAREEAECARFDARNDALAATGLAQGFLGAPLGPSLQLVQQATLVAIVFLAAREANAGLLRVGEILAIVNWSTQVMGALVMLSFHVMHLSRSLVAARRVAEILDAPVELPDGPCAEPPADGSVEFRGVSFSYGGADAEPVFRSLDLRVEPGERVAITGPTGSGKTTLLALVARFRDATGGSVRVGGRDVRDYTLGALRSALGIVGQTTRLFAGTIAGNLRLAAPDAPDEALEEAARVAQARDFVRAFPDGFGTAVSQGGASLSGGQRQRLSLARALLRRPKILLLDDATSAVDPATERALRAELARAAPGTTVIAVTQRPDTLVGMDRVLVLENGVLRPRGEGEGADGAARPAS